MVFRTLVSQYPDWSSLHTFLTSDEGGLLRVIDDDIYPIIRYVKGVSDFSKPHVAFFRSVVWNKVAHRPVSVAPMKAQKGEPATGIPLRVTDFIDGVMFHGFNTAGTTMIATRTSLGALCRFYSQRCFADLLEDAMKPMGGSKAFLKSLPPNTFISLVLQHPEHKTVAAIETPRVFITYFGTVAEDGHVAMSADPSTWPQRFAALAPTLYEPSKVFEDTEALSLLRSSSLGYAWQGLVFQDLSTSRRWRLRNPEYIAVRNLRGSEANQTARFLRLRAEGKMKEYIGYFREESAAMWALEQRLRARTQGLYDAYSRLHKAKSATMRDLPLPFRTHVYAIHGQYMAKFSTGGEPGQKPPPVLKETVIAYVNALPQEEQVRLIDAPLERAPASAPAPVAHA
jgi:hypothetical protein